VADAQTEPDAAKETESKPKAIKEAISAAAIGDIGEKLKTAMTQKQGMKVAERLAALKQSLGLSDAQMEQLKPLVARMMAESDGFDLSSMIGGKVELKMEDIEAKRKATKEDKKSAETELSALLATKPSRLRKRQIGSKSQRIANWGRFNLK
jgi:hypothetical protein